MGNKDRRHTRRYSARDFADEIAEASPVQHQPLVQQTERGILIPHGADLGELISELEALHAERSSGNEVIKLDTELRVPPWEGAQALVTALTRTFRFARQLPDQIGNREQLYIPISQHETINIPWSVFDLPGLSGKVEMYSAEVNEQMVFRARFTIARKYEDRVRALTNMMYTIASTQCLHRGKAFSIAFRDANGSLLDMPMPGFFELSPELPVFSRKITESIERNIEIPIMYANELMKKGKSCKRGVLFAGPYGTGKTLLASKVARIATEAGWTFIYVKNAAELPDALRFAQRYQPVVVFAEDIDRVAGIERTDKVNELLNQLDGIDGKTVRMLTVLTTNHLKSINPAMRRPGRIDLILKVSAPDVDATERMLRAFGEGQFADTIDLTQPALMLEGQSAANIREMLQRATLEVLRRTGDIDAKIVTDDLIAMAQELLDEQADAPPEVEAAHPPRRANGDGARIAP